MWVRDRIIIIVHLVLLRLFFNGTGPEHWHHQSFVSRWTNNPRENWMEPPPPIVIWLIVNKKNWLLSSYHFKLSFQSSPAFSFTVAVFPFLTRHGRCEQHLCAAARRNAQRQSDSTFARVSNFFLFLTTRHLSLWHFRKANVSECVCVCVMPTMAAVVFETRRWWHLCRRHIIQSRHLYKTSVS